MRVIISTSALSALTKQTKGFCMGYASVCVWGGGGQFCTASTLTFFDMLKNGHFCGSFSIKQTDCPSACVGRTFHMHQTLT